MNFEDFLGHIPKIEKELLHAETAHAIMSPPERKDMMKMIDLEVNKPRLAAVMMLFYPRNEKTHLVLIVRNSYPGVHSSQIAFPGGKVEAYDESLIETALRETEEEIGILPNQITVVRQFSNVYIPPSNFLVAPFLGYSRKALIFRPDPAEVAGIIELPLDQFLDEQTVVLSKMATSYSVSIDVPAFKINDHLVWGATAMMMSELKEILKKVL